VTARYVARGIVFALVGWFLVNAAIDYNPDEAVGVDGALLELAAKDYGPWVLGFVGIGTIAFGLWSMVEARYRKPTG